MLNTIKTCLYKYIQCLGYFAFFLTVSPIDILARSDVENNKIDEVKALSLLGMDEQFTHLRGENDKTHRKIVFAFSALFLKESQDLDAATYNKIHLLGTVLSSSPVQDRKYHISYCDMPKLHLDALVFNKALGIIRSYLIRTFSFDPSQIVTRDIKKCDSMAVLSSFPNSLSLKINLQYLE